jgi:23S rRNA (uracil1939-C5)-methyltransferase
VVAAAADARRAADLFCGVGTLTFPLARTTAIMAVDADRAALDALAAAAKQARGLKPIEERWRDLFREPLSAAELRGFDFVVLDPPHAGAKAQVEQLAQSSVPTIVYVSCNPATLARDVRVLVDGGYELGDVAPIDQFVFSAELEVVAILRRPSIPKPGKKRPTRLA